MVTRFRASKAFNRRIIIIPREIKIEINKNLAVILIVKVKAKKSGVKKANSCKGEA